MTQFNVRIKQIRVSLKLTQKQFGNLIGKSESTISMYESGKREPASVAEFISISNTLGYTLDYLMGRSSNEKKYYIMRTTELLEIINSSVEELNKAIEKSKVLMIENIDNWKDESQSKIISLTDTIKLNKLKIETLKDVMSKF